MKQYRQFSQRVCNDVKLRAPRLNIVIISCMCLKAREASATNWWKITASTNGQGDNRLHFHSKN